jgi:site-specific recombinase XerC
MDAMTVKMDAGATFQTVLDQIDLVSELSPRERREMSSAIYSFAIKLNRQPGDIPARLDVVERLGRELNGVRLGISAGRLRNIKSLVRKALIATGHGAAMARLNFPLQQPWSMLIDLLPDRRSRIALARLFRIFQLIGIAPREVSPAAFTKALDFQRSSGVSRPDANYRELVLAWNRLIALHPPSVPNLVVAVPNRRNWFSLRLKDLPQSLADDINSWLTRELGRSRRNESVASERGRISGERRVAGTRRRRKSIRPSSGKSYLGLLLSFITMEVRAGIPLDSLRSLRHVVDLDNADRGLAAYEQHFGGVKRRHLGQVMRVICIVAGHWVRVDDDHLEELRAWTNEVSSGAHYGMSETTKEAVRALRDPRTLGRLLTGAETMMTQILSRSGISQRDAVLAQAAFATQFVLNAPERIHNSSRAHLDVNVRRVGSGTDQRIIIEYPAESVKNNVDLTYELSPDTIRLLDLYLARVRPKLLRNKANRWLFPGEDDGPKGASLLSAQIAAFTEKHVGVRLTAHRLRPAAGYIHLRRSGNDTLTVQRLLGHKDLKTTARYYIWFSQDEATRAYDESLRLTRDELAPFLDVPVRRVRRKRRDD